MKICFVFILLFYFDIKCEKSFPFFDELKSWAFLISLEQIKELVLMTSKWLRMKWALFLCKFGSSSSNKKDFEDDELSESFWSMILGSILLGR